MEAIEELSELSEAMLQASALLADEDVDDPSPKRKNTFLNVVALGNVVITLLRFLFFIHSNIRMSSKGEQIISFFGIILDLTVMLRRGRVGEVV
jgi:hypothetical protein